MCIRIMAASGAMDHGNGPWAKICGSKNCALKNRVNPTKFLSQKTTEEMLISAIEGNFRYRASQ